MPSVPVSWGELIDKITILELKSARLESPAALENVRRELSALKVLEDELAANPELAALRAALAEVNAALWEIEDAIREHEDRGDFGGSFVELARSVYQRNDERAALKRKINLRLGSELVEEKGYAPYRRA